MKRKAWSLLVTLVLVALCAPIYAQDDADQDATLITFGEVISGQIFGSKPLDVYTFEAFRCDFLAISVRTTSGDLDPVVTMVDSAGNAVLLRDDADGTQNVHVEPFNIPQTGRYQIVVGRFGYALGTTTGTYELLIERIGNGSNPNCAMRYGDTVFYAIRDTEIEIVYSFRALQGDILNVSMRRRSGNLDPLVKIVDAAGVILASNDDMIGSKDSAIEAFVVPADGTYFLFATRYDGEGNFSLTLEEAANSGLGNSALAALPIQSGTQIEGAISDEQTARYYRFQARQNDIIGVTMTRLTGNLDTLIVLTNASLQELVENDDLNSETQNSAITEYLIPADGTYYLIATRFEREAGRTSGTYRLNFESAGNAFDSLPAEVRRLQYGTSTTGTIDDVIPAVEYAFFGEAGDQVRVTMDTTGGNLDPTLNLLSEDGTLLLRDDDSGPERNARIDRYTLPATGVYRIRATRYDGIDNANTSGSFILVLAQVFEPEG